MLWKKYKFAKVRISKIYIFTDTDNIIKLTGRCRVSQLSQDRYLILTTDLLLYTQHRDGETGPLVPERRRNLGCPPGIRLQTPGKGPRRAFTTWARPLDLTQLRGSAPASVALDVKYETRQQHLCPV